MPLAARRSSRRSRSDPACCTTRETRLAWAARLRTNPLLSTATPFTRAWPRPTAYRGQTMSVAADLPGVHTALLDAETLAALFRDLSLAARVLDVRVKSQTARYASTEAWSLEAARVALAEGHLSGIQVRYVLGTQVWRDTLMSTPEGTRLVRIEEPAAP